MNLALFDFDGTITTDDTYTKFLNYSTPRWKILAGRLILSSVIIGYKCRIIPGNLTRKIVTKYCFLGENEGKVRADGERYSNEVIPALVRPNALERIQWHKSQGDTVVVVSASLNVYLTPWCKKHQLHLICSELEAKDGNMTGSYVSGDCSGENKVKRIVEKFNLKDYPVIYAYGDTKEDLPMLGIAHKKYYQWSEI
jgi:phosphatidylglycerophosphatase C